MKKFSLSKIKAILPALFIFLSNPQLALAQVPPPTQIIDNDRVINEVNRKVGCTIVSCGLGGLISNILSIVFGVAGIIAFIWALVGVFQYITSGGNKEGLAKARARITWALIGLLFLIISFSLSQYVRDLFNIRNINVGPAPIPPQP